LEELQDEVDTNSTNKILTETIRETGKEIACTRKKRESKISEETKPLMKKRTEMKEEENYIKGIEYIALNKTARKKMREVVRRYNEIFVRNTIEKNKSLNKTTAAHNREKVNNCS